MSKQETYADSFKNEPLIFEMAAMPFPLNGIWVDLGNLARIFQFIILFKLFQSKYFQMTLFELSNLKRDRKIDQTCS